MLSVRLYSRNGAVKISNPRRVATPFLNFFERCKMNLENMGFASLFKGQYCSAGDQGASHFFYNRKYHVPKGHFENSPAFQRRERQEMRRVPQGRLKYNISFDRPYGTYGQVRHASWR
jgi:hypothetical protein